jgi:hypothetical protein
MPLAPPVTIATLFLILPIASRHAILVNHRFIDLYAKARTLRYAKIAILWLDRGEAQLPAQRSSRRVELLKRRRNIRVKIRMFPDEDQRLPNPRMAKVRNDHLELRELDRDIVQKNVGKVEACHTSELSG